MFGLPQSGIAPSWKPIEDDFLLGACSRHIIGFATRGPDRRWSAFDEHSRPIGEFTALDLAKAAIRASHDEAHAIECSSPRSRVWSDLTSRTRMSAR